MRYGPTGGGMLGRLACSDWFLVDVDHGQGTPGYPVSSSASSRSTRPGSTRSSVTFSWL